LAQLANYVCLLFYVHHKREGEVNEYWYPVVY